MRARFATTLDPRAVTFGARVGVTSAALGEPLISWQRTAADLITAIDPDRPDRWRYPLVVITVPRQSGKTTLLRAVHLDRLLIPLPSGRPTKPTTIWMTAQTGKDARRRFADLADRVGAAPALRGLFARRRSVGSEHLAIGNTAFGPFAPTASALHGETTPFVSVDEAWSFDEPHSAALLAAIVPPTQNIPGSQLIIISTAGTRESVWLWSLVKAGRAATTDPHARMAYLEYSADPRYGLDSNTGGLDPYDPAALDFHPAVGAGPGLPETAADITALYEQSGGIDNVRRSYLNLWPADMDTATLRSLASFDAAVLDGELPRRGPIVIAVDVARDRSGAAIYGSYRTATGRHVGLIESGPGAAWLAHHPALKQGATRPWHDPTGYTGAAVRDLNGQHATPADLAAATADFLAGIADGTITVDDTPELRTQFEQATTRPSGGGFMFDPATSPGPIDHLRAAALASYKANLNPTPIIGW